MFVALEKCDRMNRVFSSPLEVDFSDQTNLLQNDTHKSIEKDLSHFCTYQLDVVQDRFSYVLYTLDMEANP